MNIIEDLLDLIRGKAKKNQKIVIDDGTVLLRQKSVLEPSVYTLNARTYQFTIELTETREVIGRCELRIGMNEDIYYLGQVGYNIQKKHRGHHYAYYATLLLFKIAKNIFKMDELYITCSPENIPSYKTLQKLDGELLEVADVPRRHFLYRQNEKVKCIFRYKL